MRLRLVALFAAATICVLSVTSLQYSDSNVTRLNYYLAEFAGHRIGAVILDFGVIFLASTSLATIFLCIWILFPAKTRN